MGQNKTMFAKKRGTRTYTRIAVAVVLVSLLFPLSAFADQVITQGYDTTQNIPAEAIVSIKNNSSNTVIMSDQSSSNSLLGVVVDNNNSQVSLSDGNTQVQVASSGVNQVLVTDLNGKIVAGDEIAASPIAGVGMLATQNAEVIGTNPGGVTYTANGGGFRATTYTMGYSFTPSVSGSVTQLGEYCPNNSGYTDTLQLWTSGGTQLASVTGSPSGSGWTYFNITPVNLTANTTYVVSVYDQGSGGPNRGGYCSSTLAMPVTEGDVTINHSVYNGGNGDNFPNNTSAGTMYGIADLTYSALIPANVQQSATFIGMVGIGTTTPNNELSVEGNIAASGTITGGVASPDYAEEITATDPSTIQAGDLVSMDPNNPGQVILSNGDYDHNLAGVISTHPGFITNATSATVNGGVSDPSQKPLALSGRVPVNVTGENGPILPGDYLTASATPGYAMKATEPGPVIGEAMSGFNGTTGSEQGQVTVLLKYSYYTPSNVVAMQGGSPTFASATIEGGLSTTSLNVSGAATVNSLNVTGTATIAGLNVGNLSVSGPSTFYDTVSVIDGNGKPLFSVDTQNSTIFLGDGTNGLVISASSKNSFEPMLVGSARHHESIALPAMYSGSIENSSQDSACVNAHNGTLSTVIDSNSRQNMYQWTSNSSTPQCEDIVIDIPIPANFSAWNGAPTLSVLNTKGQDNTSVEAEAVDVNGNVDSVYNGYVGIPSAPTVSTAKLPGLNIGTGNSYTAGGYMTLKIRLTASKGSSVSVGNLTLSYLSAF